MKGENVEDLVRRAQRGEPQAIATIDAADDWHLKRRTGIGGSDVAAVLGLNPDRRPIDVYLEKIGETAPFEGNERTVWGKILEPVVAAHYLRRHGGPSECYLDGPYDTARRADTPWHLYTLDRLILARALAGCEAAKRPPPPALIVKILEIKTHGFFGQTDYGEPGTDEVPFTNMCQTAWYSAGLGCNGGADLAVLFDTHLYREFHVPRDAEVEGYLREEVEHFWKHHVLARVEPTADGSASFARYLRRRFSKTNGELLPVDADTQRLIEQLRAVECLGRLVEDRKAELRQTLGAMLGDADGFDIANRERITFKFDKRGRVNHSAVAEELAKRLGMGSKALKELQDQHRYKAARRFLTPRVWLEDELSTVCDGATVAGLLAGADR